MRGEVDDGRRGDEVEEDFGHPDIGEFAAQGKRSSTLSGTALSRQVGLSVARYRPVFTLTQLALPLIIRFAGDNGMTYSTSRHRDQLRRGIWNRSGQRCSVCGTPANESGLGDNLRAC